MEYNVYDFDGTLYRDDVTKDFYCFSVRRFPAVLCVLPGFLLKGILYWVGVGSKNSLKECFFRFLQHIPSVDGLVRDFWKTHLVKVKQFYDDKKTEQDIIISASPDFLLQPLLELIGVSHVIATIVDTKTGKLRSENCFGEEKVRRFFTEYPGATIGYFYSDNLSDLPLSRIAKKSFFVRGNRIISCNNEVYKNNRGLSQDG